MIRKAEFHCVDHGDISSVIKIHPFIDVILLRSNDNNTYGLSFILL
jgi:hypothetical protein